MGKEYINNRNDDDDDDDNSLNAPWALFKSSTRCSGRYRDRITSIFYVYLLRINSIVDLENFTHKN